MSCSIIRNNKTNEIERVLAPNGKDSILFNSIKNLGFPKEEALRYWAQVYTPSFKAWFGDWENDPENASKVIDKNGEPLVVYHMGPKGIEIFKEEEFKMGEFKPIFFTPNKDYAFTFLEEWRFFLKGNEQLYAVFLNIPNLIGSVRELYTDRAFDMIFSYQADGVVGREFGTGKGFDIPTAYSYAVVDAGRIKSVSNQGTFNPTTKSIHFSELPYVSDSWVEKSSNLERDDATNTYKDKTAPALVLDAVTSYLANFQTRPIKTNFDAATVAADALWKNKPKEAKVLSKEFSSYGELTYEQYVALKKESFDKFIARAEIYHLKFHKEFSKDPAATSKMIELMNAYEITDGEIDWLNSEKIKTILETRTGTDFWNTRGKKRDKILTEINISSALLGLAGRVDLMIDHGDNVVSLYDIKTGYGISKEWENYLFKYGDTFGLAIWDNPLNRAKLQVMLYALILKSQNPALKFKQLKVLHIPSEIHAMEDSMKTEVDPQPFLEIIEQFYKKEHPDKYAALVKESPNIFKVEEYMAVTKEQVRVTEDPAMSLRMKILELQNLVMYNKLQGSESQSRNDKIKQLMEEIIALKKDNTMSLASWYTDMSWMDSWLGSASYSTNPYVQLYYQMLADAKQKVRNDYEPWRRKFDTLLENALREIGINPKPTTKLIGGPDSNKLFENFVKVDKYGEERFITDTNPADKAEWDALGTAQKELLRFILDSNDQFFIDDMSTYTDPRTGKKIAMANKVATYRKTRRGKVPVTALGLYNKELVKVGQKKRGDVFEWKRGFLPKGAPLLEDVTRDHGWLSKEMVRFLWNRYMSNFVEQEFDKWDNTTEAIPLKGLGSASIVESKNYSRNLEYVIDTFVKQNFYKLHMDEVYVFGNAMQIYLKLKEEAADNVIFTHTISWFEDSIDLHILGKKKTDDKWVKRTPKINTATGYAQFNFTKFLRSLKGFFVAPTMWLKPFTGLPNGVFASLVTMREGLKGAIFGKSAYGLNDIREGFGIAIGMQTDAMVGKLRENKAYLLMEKYGYLPDNFDWFTRPNELLTARNKLFTARTMMAFHTLPEEVVATAIFVAQLKAMKLEDGSSMWDHYKVETLDDAHVVKWDGTIRGKRSTSNIEGLPQYTDVGELEIEEVNAIKFTYEKLHGGYRLDERVRLEYYVLGEMFLQFRKFLPGVFKNIGASRGWRQTQGKMIATKDAEGNTILKWSPEVVEGRWRLLAGLMLNYIGIKRQLNPQGEPGNKLMQFLGRQTNPSYSWDSLSAAQKEDLQDFMLTWITFIAMFVGYSAAWDRDEEDTVAKMYKRIMQDMAITTQPMEILRNSFTLPVSWEKTKKLGTATVDLTLSLFLDAAGYDDDALTKEGQYKGWKEFQRNVPFLGSIHSWQKAVSESETFEDLDLKLR